MTEEMTDATTEEMTAIEEDNHCFLSFHKEGPAFHNHAGSFFLYVYIQTNGNFFCALAVFILNNLNMQIIETINRIN